MTAGTACASASAAAGRAVPRRPQRSQEELGALLDGVGGAGDGVPNGLWGREDLVVVATLHDDHFIQHYTKREETLFPARNHRSVGFPDLYMQEPLP